jgi:hypothetical protein
MFSATGRKRLVASEGEQDICWAVSLVRWAVLVAIVLIALFDPTHRFPGYRLGFYVAGFSAYSLTITLLLALGLFTRSIPGFTLLADTLAMLVLIHLSGGVDSPFSFFPLFPILVATSRYSWRTGGLVAAIFVVSDVLRMVLIAQTAQGISWVYQAGLHAGLYLLAILVSEVTSRRPATSGRGGPDARVQDDSIVPDDVKMIYEMASTLSATLNYERVLEAILDISRMGFVDLGHRVGESVGMVLLYDQEGLLFVAI